MQQSSENNHSRLRNVLLILGLLAAVTFWQVGLREERNEADAAGFVDVTEEDEEDFVTSKRSAINTVKLPATDFLTPVYKSSKPSLILHVGPVKSGVRELQKELLAHKAALDIDDYTLSASIDTSGLHEVCQRELNLLRQGYFKKKKKKTKSTLRQVLEAVPCWKTFLDVLKPLKESGASLIVSDEQLSQQFLPDVYGIGPAVLDWITLRETIMDDWNVVVVVSYRRYYDWLLAAKGATEQYHLQQHSSKPPRLARWPGKENGMLLEPLYPHFVHDAIEKLDVPFTDRVLELYRPFVSATKVLNLYATGQSACTSFLCDVLEAASSSCADSRQQDLKANDTASNNTLRTTPALFLDTAADAAWSDFQLFNELVTTAAARSLIRSKRVTRTAATTTTEYYVEQYMKMRAHDLPLSCPKGEQLQGFLRQSLNYEKKILPRAFAKSAEKAHTKGFEEMGNQFCSIDMHAVLRQQHWRTFFRHLTNNSAQRIQAGGKPGPGRKYFLRG
jgi:hypothetical protein